MAYSLSFSALNERMRPQITSSEKVYSSLNRLEYRLTGSLRSYPTYYRPTVLPPKPEPQVLEAAAEPEEPEEPRENAEQQEDLASDSPENNSCLTEGSLKDECGEEDGGLSLSKDKDLPGEMTSTGTGAPSQSAADEGGSPLQMSYIDGTLPDLIRSGRPLGRRRTLGHVSDTLKEVRREVELSRRRSIKLKAQVDKLQESREGQGWSQHRERVTDEILSILRLLRPLTEPESAPPEPPHQENQLDVALAQLQNVARKLAMSHSTQLKPGRAAEDNAILQQALYDRDEAIEKKKAMEAELLRSKTEMMSLNNQLLEAVQKRLELSLELEAWKEDVQLILHQQVQSQQQAEQSPKKPSRMGLLRRNNRPLIQRPSSVPSSPPVPPTTISSQIFVSGSSVSAAPSPRTASPPPPPPGTQRNWRDKLRRGRGVRSGEQDAAGPSESDNGFQVISLD